MQKSVSIRFDLSQIFGIDLRTLALFRIALALVLLFDLFMRALDVSAFYTDAGVLPRSAQIEIYSGLPSLISLHLMSGTLGAQLGLFAVSFAAALSLLVGYRTTTATFVSWVLLVSIHNRNPMVLQGGDVLLRLLLFWSLFLPIGARASLDRLLASNHDTLASNRAANETSPPNPDSPRVGADETTGLSANSLLVSTATLAALLQVCFVYWFTSAMKTDASWRVDGTALGYALSIDQLSRPLGRFLLGFPDLLRPLTFFTLALERFGPFVALLPFWRLRTGMVIIFIVFHLVMGLCLTLGIFTWIAPVAWLLFIPSDTWNWLEHRLAALRPGKLQSAVTCVQVPAEKARLGLTTQGRKLGLRTVSPRRAFRWNQNGTQILCAFLLVYVFGWNLRALDFSTYGRFFPQSWNWIGDSMRLDQVWDMFSPFPLKEDGWFVAPARLVDGSEINLMKDGEPVRWEEPADLSTTFRDPLWQKYLLNLWAASNSAHRAPYAAYLVRGWNENHDVKQRIRSLQIIYMRQNNLPGFRKDKIQRVVVWQQNF